MNDLVALGNGKPVLIILVIGEGRHFVIFKFEGRRAAPYFGPRSAMKDKRASISPVIASKPVTGIKTGWISDSDYEESIN